jgi:hypothetical protein
MKVAASLRAQETGVPSRECEGAISRGKKQWRQPRPQHHNERRESLITGHVAHHQPHRTRFGEDEAERLCDLLETPLRPWYGYPPCATRGELKPIHRKDTKCPKHVVARVPTTPGFGDSEPMYGSTLCNPFSATHFRQPIFGNPFSATRKQPTSNPLPKTYTQDT